VHSGVFLEVRHLDHLSIEEHLDLENPRYVVHSSLHEIDHIGAELADIKSGEVRAVCHFRVVRSTVCLYYGLSLFRHVVAPGLLVNFLVERVSSLDFEAGGEKVG
jgi:hypothetical protein